jgi:serine/threonine protein kinase
VLRQNFNSKQQVDRENKIMAKVRKKGDVIGGYRLTSDYPVHTGAFTICYHAERDGAKVFFKQYKSPSCRVDWYKGYCNYVKAVRKRIEEGACGHSTYDILDTFEEGGELFQAFEFVPDQKDLKKFLDSHDPDRPGRCKSWEQRVIFAKLLMDCVKKFHVESIVHADLKPENVVLIEDPSISTGYYFKLADMDFSILSDMQAPWHGKQGYVGTPHYMSPEHIKGEVPGTASDVFTCGIMLYELLCNDYPYALESGDYHTKVISNDTKDPVLLGKYPEQSSEAIDKILKDCLTGHTGKYVTILRSTRPRFGMTHQTHPGGGSRVTGVNSDAPYIYLVE